MENKPAKKSLFVQFDSKQLKMIGFILVFLYTFSFAILQNGVLKAYQYEPEVFSGILANNSQMYNIAAVSTMLMMLVGACLPIYALLLVEGFDHTRNVWKYLLGLAVLALLSEVPYDMCMHHSFWYGLDQNPIFTLCFCLIMLELCELVNGVPKGWKLLFKIFIVVSSICWTTVVKSSFGFSLVMMCFIYKELSERNLLKNLLASLMGLIYVTCPFAIYLLYGHQPIRGNIKNKYSFYGLYLGHLVVLAIISYWCTT